ncbi:replication protein (plasmid) [Salmonella enterica subsp. enterica serovar Typhimurium]|nr:replication protein [Salmonella enterica subsp. enterica serovar Typhimurium]
MGKSAAQKAESGAAGDG